jgi:hypothetical protein
LWTFGKTYKSPTRFARIEFRAPNFETLVRYGLATDRELPACYANERVVAGACFANFRRRRALRRAA